MSPGHLEACPKDTVDKSIEHVKEQGHMKVNGHSKEHFV